MSSFTPDGLEIDRLDDIFNKIIADLQSLWGDNIKSTPDSKIGGHATIYSESVADQNELIESVVAAFQPGNAKGVFLSEIVRFNGIERNENKFSSVVLDCTADPAAGTTIPFGAIVEDPATGIQVQVITPTVIPAGLTLPVAAQALDEGAIVIEANTMTKIVTAVFGWISVDNPAAGEVGQAEESDPELRARRDIAAEQKASCGVAAIFTAIFDIQEVTDVAVHDNKGTTTDGLGVPPGQVWCIVEGGAEADIIEQISTHVAGGIGTAGTISVIYNDPITGYAETIKYDRPTLKNTWLTISLTKGSKYPGDGDDLITAALIDYFDLDQKLGVDVINSTLYSVVNTAVNFTASINAIYTGFSASPGSESDLLVAINEKAITDETRITVS
jgi:uncharacterized phage protein gp47/JayE